jgi:hypothetical protein
MSRETTRLPFWKAWTPNEALFLLGSPLLVVAAIGWVGYLVHLGIGTSFDDAHVGATVVGTLAFAVGAVVGGYGTSRLKASMRSVTMQGACPCCGAMRQRTFEDPSSSKSPPTPCGACIAYLRATGDEMREEAVDAFEMIRTPYVLTAEQYRPAVKLTNRGGYTFEMPTMCAVCGDPAAPHRRDIGNGDSLADDLGALGALGSVVSTVADVPRGRVGPVYRVVSSTAPDQAEKDSRGLSHLKAPVCAKHTEKEESFGDALEYSSGKLEFASYRFYKAFCELNHIDRGSSAVTESR